MADTTTIKSPSSAAPDLSEFQHLPAWRRPDWQEDPESVLGARLDQLMGLASCLTVLGRADRTSEVVDELIDDALPMLGWVMQNLSMEAIRANDAIERRRKETLGEAVGVTHG
jgi:hypothetical protein